VLRTFLGQARRRVERARCRPIRDGYLEMSSGRGRQYVLWVGEYVDIARVEQPSARKVVLRRVETSRAIPVQWREQRHLTP